MSTRDLFDLQAGEASNDEDDEDFDEETGQGRARKTNGVNGDLEDSSEEDDDDEDEEAARKIREGFIVDEDEEEDPAERRRRRKERKKRRREEREEEGLDEEDLDLIGELPDRRGNEPTFKRLKRGHRDERERERGVDDIFSDEDEELRPGPSTSRNALAGEFDDFIEEDEPDEGEGAEEDHEVMVGRTKRGLDALKGLDAGLDEAAIEDMRAAFGDGTEYDWALDMQEDMDIGEVDPDKPVQLKDIFEPSQLREKMLTDEDETIRYTDIPERMQLARKEFPREDLNEEQWRERISSEAEWVSTMLWPKKQLPRALQGPFKKAVAHVLDFMNVGSKEVPYIFQHRKDYLIHAGRPEEDGDSPGAQQQQPTPEKLLNQTDLWEISELDLKYRSYLLKKQALERLYENIKSVTSVDDPVIESLLPGVTLVDDVQDLSDYLHFRYAAEIKDFNVRESVNGQKRSRAVASVFERTRASGTYNVVSGFGISADNYATIVLNDTQRAYPEDPEKKPMDLADQYIDESFPLGRQVLKAAKETFAEELAMHPKMRKLMRRDYYMTGHFSCHRTSKGLKQIDEDNPNYEFKYLREQNLSAMARRPELFLRMLKAEADKLIELRLSLGQREALRRRLRSSLESDNFSEVADAWNLERREVIDIALSRLDQIIVKGVKENLKTECENAIAARCRERYSEKLDQAPYQPRGMDSGVVPRVLTLNCDSNSRAGVLNYVWMEEEGRVLESKHFAMAELRLGSEEKGLVDGNDVAKFVALLEEKRPDVVGISGFTPETRQLYKLVQEIIAKFDVKSNPSPDDEDMHRHDDDRRDLLEVVVVNDEVARLYYTSERAAVEFPALGPGSRYCIAVARYLQSPIKEYAALGSDILSINFDAHQGLLPPDKLKRYLESAMIDMVNLTGVEINDALADTYTANLLPYVCGLGPRKASYMLQVINKQGGQLNTRVELLGNDDESRLPAVTPTVFENCASFLFIKYDSGDAENVGNYLDNTRAHPDDYDLANKMAADALDLDEEDVKFEKDQGGEYAVLKKMVKESRESEINSLVLERYAEQIEEKMGQRKRATLETIRAELSDPYEELRREFNPPSTDEVFTMLTGETRDSLCDGMIVPIEVRKAFPDHVEVKLDCGIEGGIPESDYPSGVGAGSGTDPRVAFRPHQFIQGKVLFVNRKQLTAQLSVKEDLLRQPFKKEFEKVPGEWDFAQEEADKREAMKEKESVTGRPQRVIKHPLFKPFNSAQAEEWLGPQNRGDVVIRPSSKGMDHLAVTWKVSDNVFQHIDVLELDKENEFSVGKTLKIGGRYTYSDLDELIAVHVKSMAKKVDEITADERFQRGSKVQAEQWLTAYMEANPKRSMYAFCINQQYPGYFFLCFKPSPQASHMAWPIKVIPNAFELQKNPYPDMRALKNGFKTLFMKQAQMRRF